MQNDTEEKVKVNPPLVWHWLSLPPTLPFSFTLIVLLMVDRFGFTWQVICLVVLCAVKWGTCLLRMGSVKTIRIENDQK